LTKFEFKQFGDYEILSLLGRGGMGEVYRARTPEGEEVALKIIRSEASGQTDSSLRFRREMRLAFEVAHPNVVRAMDAGEEEGRFYLASEVIGGGSLHQLIMNAGILPPSVCLPVMRDIMAGLDEIHRHGMIHRDMKPQNILLDSEGTAKIADFGLARATTPHRSFYTAPGTLLGTTAYVSPEQILNDGDTDLDIRCDLYSCGIILFKCLAGEAPFKGRSDIDVLHLHIHATPPDILEFAPDAGGAVSQLIFDLLQKKREKRPGTPGQVHGRLLEIIASRDSFEDDVTVADMIRMLEH